VPQKGLAITHPHREPARESFRRSRAPAAPAPGSLRAFAVGRHPAVVLRSPSRCGGSRRRPPAPRGRTRAPSSACAGSGETPLAAAGEGIWPRCGGAARMVRCSMFLLVIAAAGDAAGDSAVSYQQLSIGCNPLKTLIIENQKFRDILSPCRTKNPNSLLSPRSTPYSAGSGKIRNTVRLRRD
jgi:hypothetical protein